MNSCAEQETSSTCLCCIVSQLVKSLRFPKECGLCNTNYTLSDETYRLEMALTEIIDILKDARCMKK